MSDAPTPRARRPLWRYLPYATVALLLIFGGIAWYVTSDSFQAMVHRRLVAEIEAATGGRVEVGGFHATPFRFRVEVRDLTIHGREGPGEVPYVHLDRLLAQIKVISVLGAEFGFDSLVLERPVVHIITYPDGTTNQPEPKLKTISEKRPLERIFALSIDRLEARRGEFFWNDQKTPLDFLVYDVSADMSYSVLHRRYEANLLLGKVDTTYDGYRPFAWTAEAHFTLGRQNMEVRELKATSGRSRIAFSGQVRNYRQPQIEGTYELTADLGEIAAIARRRDVRRGLLEASGKGSWSASDFASDGKLSLKDFDYNEEPVVLEKATLSTRYSVSPKKLTLTQIEARLLGGAITGDADLVNWMAPEPQPRAAAQRKAEETRGLARLRLRDLSATAIAAALSTRAHPLDRFRFSGAASGTVEAHWQGSWRRMETSFALDLIPPAKVPAGRLPINARARGTYRAGPGELELSELSVRTPATQIQAAGTLSQSAALKISLSTTDLSEWEPVIAAFGKSLRIPVVLQGRATFNGTASGKLSEMALAGNLQLEAFDSLIPATSRTPEHQVHWDSASADIQISQHSVAARHAALVHGDTSIHFDVAGRINDGELNRSSPFTARVVMHHADVNEIMALAGLDYPINGSMDLRLVASGTPEQPHGEGQVVLSNAVVYGERVDRFSSDLRLNGSELGLNNIDVTQYGGHLSGGVSLDLSSRAVQFNLTGQRFDLTQIPKLRNGRVPVEGRLDFTAAGGGTIDHPALDATFQIRDLYLDREHAGDFTIQASTQGDQLHVTGRSSFDHAELNIDGDVHLAGDFPSTWKVHLAHLDVDSLLRTYLPGKVTGHSAVAGELTVTGPLRHFRDMTATGDLSELYAEIEHIKIHNDGPVRFAVNQQELRIDQFQLASEGTDLSATGTLGLAGDHEVDLKAQGRANLQLIESFNPDFTSSGNVVVDVALSGALMHPHIQGRLQVQNGSIAYVDLPSALSDINGSLVFTRNRLEIESLTAHTGGGNVSFGGYAVTVNRQLHFDLTVRGQDVRLRYPPGVSSNASADLRWSGTSQESTLSGDITINRLALQPRFDFASYMAKSSQQSTLPQTNPLLNRIHLDVHVVTAPELEMQTAVVRLSGDADLHMRGTAAKPVLLGRADVTEGELSFNGAKYRLERGDVIFTNPVSTTPVLDLQATTRVRDYDISVNVNGPPDRMHIVYRSEPPLPEADIIALLALGRTQEESAQLQQSGQSSVGQAASGALLAEALNATVSNRAQQLFGVSRIKVDPEGLTTETNTARGPQVTIEQQVTNSLTVTYSTNVSQASQQIIQAEYNITRTVSLVGVRDQNGVISIDVRMRQRKK